MSTTVIRTTTDKLEAVIAEQETEDRTLISSQFTGGRDWVLFFTQMITFDTVGAMPDVLHPCGSTSDDHVRTACRVCRESEFGDERLACSMTPWNGFVVGRYNPNRTWQDVDGSQRAGREYPYAGWIEDEARTWIVYFDSADRPVLLWRKRDVDGGVMGEPISLSGCCGPGGACSRVDCTGRPS